MEHAVLGAGRFDLFHAAELCLNLLESIEQCGEGGGGELEVEGFERRDQTSGSGGRLQL